jgi:transcriptional regulator with XRE-family HTH domain
VRTEAEVGQQVEWTTSGEVLRWWRHDVAGWSQRTLADRLDVRPTTVSNWENGSRSISVTTQRRLDAAFGAGGAVAGLLWALGSRDGLDPRHGWSHVFNGPSTPVWGWIRSPAPTVKLEGEWGLFAMAVELDIGPNGAFITVGASVDAAAVVGRLSEAGWIDFGRGVLPPVPGAMMVDGLEVVIPSSSQGVFEERFAADVADRFAGHPRAMARASHQAPQTLSAFFRRFTRTDADRFRVSGPWPPVPDHFGPADRTRFHRLREARSLSLSETIALLKVETGLTVSKDALRRFETGASRSPRMLLPVALDHVLRASGQLAVVELRTGRGPGSVQLPPFWRAPTWVALDGPEDHLQRHPGRRWTVQLRWGDWGKELQLTLPALVGMHHSEPGQLLRLHASDEVSWTAGLGRRSGAAHIDQGWVPADLGVLQKAVADVERALFEALGRKTDSPSPPGPVGEAKPGDGAGS